MHTKRFVNSMFILFLLVFSAGRASAQANQLQIKQVAAGLYVYTTYQVYGGQPFPSNSLYLVTRQGVVLFDTPWDSTQFQPLLDSIRMRHHKKVILCLATHFHSDRTGGLAYYSRQGIRTLSSAKTDSLCRLHHENRAAILFSGDSSFRVGQYRFETWFAGAGHSPDNLVVWFPQQKLLYGGCLVKSIEAGDLGNLSDADLEAWPHTIQRILERYGTPAVVIPGHQGWQKNDALQHTLLLLRNRSRSN